MKDAISCRESLALAQSEESPTEDSADVGMSTVIIEPVSWLKYIAKDHLFV